VPPSAPDQPTSAEAWLEASMIVIGDEILGGYVTDSNSSWLADRLRAHGVPLTRVHVVPDEFDAIDEAVQAELARTRPRLIVTSGGIGSTPDDITFEAVAATLGRDLVEDARIAERLDGVVTWTREQGLVVDGRFEWHLKRMARIPEGGRLLQSPDSWVPAVATDVDGGCDADGATVLILPGVPSEFRRLVGEVVEPAFLAGRNAVPTVVEIEHGFPESVLNLAFEELTERFPGVKLGSYPGAPMIVRLTGDADEVSGAATVVRRAIEDLEASPAGARLTHAWSRRSGGPDREEDA
jgi:molybdenum cofactor synthesis domain-containing protein